MDQILEKLTKIEEKLATLADINQSLIRRNVELHNTIIQMKNSQPVSEQPDQRMVVKEASVLTKQVVPTESKGRSNEPPKKAVITVEEYADVKVIKGNTFPFNSSIKRINGKKWNAGKKVWVIPVSTNLIAIQGYLREDFPSTEFEFKTKHLSYGFETGDDNDSGAESYSSERKVNIVGCDDDL